MMPESINIPLFFEEIAFWNVKVSVSEGPKEGPTKDQKKAATQPACLTAGF